MNKIMYTFEQFLPAIKKQYYACTYKCQQYLMSILKLYQSISVTVCNSQCPKCEWETRMTTDKKITADYP